MHPAAAGRADVFGHDVVRDAGAVRLTEVFGHDVVRQKVALARALLTSPAAVAGRGHRGLDPRSKREVQSFISELRRSPDTTILLCTHDLAEAEMLAERIGILHAGRLLALEPAEDLVSRYGASSRSFASVSATPSATASSSDQASGGGPLRA